MKISPQLEILVVLFCISVVVWILLMIYKSRLERRAEERVFLSGTPERLTEKDSLLLGKVNRLSKPMWAIGIITVVLLLAMLGTWIYQGLLSS